MRKAVSFVLHPDSQDPVEGLRIHKTSRRYYRITEDGSRLYYQKNGLKGSQYLRQAIYEHECNRNGQNPNETETLTLTKPAVDQFGTEVSTTATLDEHGNHINIAHVHPDDIDNYFREKLSNREVLIEWADRMRMPELLKLHTLRPTQDSMTLTDIGELYHTKNEMKDKTKGNSRVAWKEFVDFLDVKLVSEITPRHIENYHDEIMSRYRNGEGFSRSYVLNRYGTVKTVFNFASKRGKDIENVSAVQTYLKMLALPKKTVQQKKIASKNTRPIKSEHFHKLLEVADTKWRAVLLLSLNCALYPEDICNLEQTDIDLKAQTLNDFRCKTGFVRAAWLWPETVKAIQDYLTECPHNDPHLFVTQYGGKYKVNDSLTGTFREKLRVEAGIPKSVEYRHMRYGFASHAGSDLKATRIVMGQSFGGELDKYVERTVEAAKPACICVHEHYFFDGK